MGIVMGWINLAIVSLMTGFGLGFGFWGAHLFCKYLWRKLK